MEFRVIIYKATNIVNGKSYIGQTIMLLDERIKRHLYTKSNNLFYRALKKYGIESFIWEVLEHYNDEEELDEMEYHYIMQYGTYKNGYNMTYGGDGGPNGYKHSEEVRKKISENHANTSGENNSMYGKHHSKETKQKMSAARKGKRFSEDTKQKMSDDRKGKYAGENHSMYGKHHSDESKQKMSDAHKGENNHFYGKHHSEETKQKISERMREICKTRKLKIVG